MAAEQLQIQVQANVQQAIAGLNSFNTQLDATAKASESLGATSLNILNNQLLRLQRIAANPNLSTEQYQRLATIINKTSKEADGLSKSIQVLNRSNGTLTGGANQANTAMINLSRTVSDAPFGFIGIANNIGPLVENFVSLRKEAGGTGNALKQLGGSLIGPGGVIVGIQLAVAAVQFAQLGFDRWTASSKKTKEQQDKLAEGTNNLIENVTKQRVEFETLVKVAKNVNQSDEERNQALTRLNEILPDTIGKLTQQNIATEQGAAIIQNYIKAVEARATAELLVNRIAENNVKLFDNRNKTLQESQRIENELLILRTQLSRIDINATGRAGESAALRYSAIQSKINDLVKEQNNIQKEGRKTANELINLNNQLRSEYENQLPLVNDLTQKQTKQKEAIDEITKILQKYREDLKAIDWDEQNKAIDGTNERVKAAAETLKSLYLINVQETAKAWIQVQNDFNNYANLVIKRSIEIARKSPAPEFAEPIIQPIEPVADNKFFQSAIEAKTKIELISKSFDILNQKQKENYKNWEDLKITPEILEQVKKGIPIQQITEFALKTNESITQQKELYTQLSEIINSQLTGAVDNLFTGLIKGEDVFNNLGESIKNLIVQISAAVVKMLVLKAITSALAPGVGGGAIFGRFGTPDFIRGDTLKRLMFFRAYG